MARVLVIDDDASVLGAVGEALRNAGYESCAVLDGEDGIRLARQGRFDSAVVDLKLRGRNGLDVTAALHDVQHDLPVLLITGFMDFGVPIESYVRAQPFDFLQKPFTPGQLIGAVQGLIARTRLTQVPGLRPPGVGFHGLLGDSASMTVQTTKRISARRSSTGGMSGSMQTPIGPAGPIANQASFSRAVKGARRPAAVQSHRNELAGAVLVLKRPVATPIETAQVLV